MTIKDIIPKNEISTMIDKIGLPNGGINRVFMDNSTIGVSDGEILITLNKPHKSTQKYIEKMRTVLNNQYPDYVFFFQDADIISKILNFGLASPVDIKISGKNNESNICNVVWWNFTGLRFSLFACSYKLSIL